TLVDAVAEAGLRLGCSRPLFVKLSPDLAPAELESLVAALLGTPAAGLILSNSTLARPALASELAAEAGGLSGRPLLSLTLEHVRRARAIAGDRLVIVASGGIASAADVASAYQAGADLVQLWTGLVYRGPGLVGEAAAVPVARPWAAGRM
ncbi:MAG: quinone-dependent dihydroorotate dehydrogenase, partial [Candidatus Limnocylindria bacterium]